VVAIDILVSATAKLHLIHYDQLIFRSLPFKMLTKDLLDQIVVVIAINEMRLVQPNRQPQVRLRVVKKQTGNLL